jgi:hypothetical protein
MDLLGARLDEEAKADYYAAFGDGTEYNLALGLQEKVKQQMNHDVADSTNESVEV